MTEAINNPDPVKVRSSGRPSRQTAEKLRELILDIATSLFLAQGYESTSIEEIVRRTRISKRTFYHRFENKPALFAAVVKRIILRLHPPTNIPLTVEGDLKANLLHLARLMVNAAVSPQAVAIHRLIVAESGRFPELARIASEQGGSQEAISLVTGLLERNAPIEKLDVKDPIFAAQQFLQMVITIPQRRAMGLGIPMSTRELDAWPAKTVKLFLNGCRKDLSS